MQFRKIRSSLLLEVYNCALLKSGGLGGFMGMGTPFSFLRFFYFLILSCFSSFNSYLRGCIGICLVEDVGNLFYIH